MTATLTYNPRNRAARLAMEYIQSLGVFTITPLPDNRSRKKQQFEKEFRTAMSHAKAFRQGEMEFRSVDSFLKDIYDKAEMENVSDQFLQQIIQEMDI